MSRYTSVHNSPRRFSPLHPSGLSLRTQNQRKKTNKQTLMPTTNCLSFSQAGDLVLLDTTVYAAIVELLLELEGVDPEPDFWARSSRGPWHIAVNEDCMQQFRARYGPQTTIRVHQVDVPVKIEIESIEDKLNKKGASSRKALYVALQDVAAHFVVELEADGLAQASKITTPSPHTPSGSPTPHNPQRLLPHFRTPSVRRASCVSISRMGSWGGGGGFV